MADLGQKYACLISLEYTINKGCKFQDSDVTGYSIIMKKKDCFLLFPFLKLKMLKLIIILLI